MEGKLLYPLAPSQNPTFAFIRCKAVEPAMHKLDTVPPPLPIGPLGSDHERGESDPGRRDADRESRDADHERRIARRVAVDLFVQERDGDRLFVHPATNLSESGIFIESHSYSLRNALERRFIELEFSLPESDRLIAVRGEVVGARRVRGFSHGLAVRFLDLGDSDRATVAAFVGRRLADGASMGPDNEAAP